MQSFPHHYPVRVRVTQTGDIRLQSPGLDEIVSAPALAFGGPGDKWSPENLLVAAVADCFVLSFRAIASASKLDWLSLDCAVDGVLEKLDNLTQFTAFEVSATLTLPAGGRQELAARLLEKAEQVCLITNSLKAETYLSIEILESESALS